MGKLASCREGVGVGVAVGEGYGADWGGGLLITHCHTMNEFIASFSRPYCLILLFLNYIIIILLSSPHSIRL